MIDHHHFRQYVKVRLGVLGSYQWPLALATLLILLVVASGAGAGDVVDANVGQGGATLNLRRLIVKGKTTLIDFYSPFCPPCVRLAPVLEQLAAKRPDLAIRKVNINRPDVKGIDWRSPLAEQYQIKRVPYFMILSPQGKLVAQGRDAFEQVKRWLQETGLIKAE